MKQTWIDIMQHSFMIVLFIFIILMFVKNNVLFTSSDFNYFFAFSVPAIALIILAGLIIHQNFISKIQDSHQNVYSILSFSLIGVSSMLIIFFVLIGLFFDNPESMYIAAYIAFIPYYFSILSLALFFVYISPGLMSPGPTGSQDIYMKRQKNIIQFYQVIMAYIYFGALLLVYPALFIFDAEWYNPSQVLNGDSQIDS